MKYTIITAIMNLISITVAVYILVTIINSIRQTIIETNNGSMDTKKNPFGNTLEQKEEINASGFKRFAGIGAFILPFLIYSVIYLMLRDQFYDLFLKYLEDKGIAADIGGAIIAISAFFLGVKCSRKFIKGGWQSDDLFSLSNLTIYQKRLDNVEIAYLSSTFFLIIFNYLDFDLSFNIIKAITTSFVAGNIYYIVFRYNAKQ